MTGAGTASQRACPFTGGLTAMPSEPRVHRRRRLRTRRNDWKRDPEQRRDNDLFRASHGLSFKLRGKFYPATSDSTLYAFGIRWSGSDFNEWSIRRRPSVHGRPPYPISGLKETGPR